VGISYRTDTGVHVVEPSISLRDRKLEIRGSLPVSEDKGELMLSLPGQAREKELVVPVFVMGR